MLVLVDGDIFRYRCAAAAEHTYYLVELTNASGFREYKEFDYKKEADDYGKRVTKGVSATYRVWSRKEVQPVENALQIAKSSLENALDAIRDKFGKELKVRVFLSGKANFRNDVAVTKPYKGNRDEVQKPTYYRHVGEYLLGNWNAEITEGYEADDAIGIASVEAKTGLQEFVIVSNDKDLDQIPGLHYDWVAKEFYTVSPKEGKVQFYTQLLAGDATDNIPGLPGIGKSKAAAALAECKSPNEMMQKCEALYSESFATGGPNWWDYLAEQADLVYILKKPNEPWSKTKEGIEFKERYAVHQ